MKLNRLLSFICIFLAAFIVFSSVIVLVTKKGEPGKNLRSEETPQKVLSAAPKKDMELDSFNELGRLRIVTRAPSENENGTVLVVLPWISYPSDSQFYEELYKKRSSIKSEITSYFSSRTKQELQKLGEDSIKNQLRDRINTNLSLGKISGIYFTDYIFFE